jgi:hypothetical protein
MLESEREETMSPIEREPHFGPRPQTDLEAASSAGPDTDRPPLWDDPEHEAYILATTHYDDEDEDEDEDWDEDEEDREDDEDSEPDPGWEEDEKDLQRIATEWRDFDTDPPGS